MLSIPEYVQAVLHRLEESGHEAWVVGGCVRDSLLGAPPHDWDVTTSAHPEQTLHALQPMPVLKTGLRHGTVTALSEGKPVEVTTYRIDGDYTDNRRPDKVTFTRSLREDLARRDFTINAMAYHPKRGLADYFGGRRDLEAKMIRCVGEPARRLTEDALRILRALRFSAQLGFSIEEASAAALLQYRPLLTHIAAERIYSELCRLLCGPYVLPVLLRYSPVITQILPELAPAVGFDQRNPHHCYGVYEHIAHSVAAVPPRLELRLAMLLHDAGKPACCTEDAAGVRHFYGHPKVSAELAQAALTRLRADNRTRELVCLLIKQHDCLIEPSKRQLCRLLSRFGEPFVRCLLQVKHADNEAQSPLARRRAQLNRLDELLERILQEQHCFCLRNLAVNGRDLLKAGVKFGPEVGRQLNRLLALVVEGVLPNEKEALLQALFTEE